MDGMTNMCAEEKDCLDRGRWKARAGYRTVFNHLRLEEYWRTARNVNGQSEVGRVYHGLYLPLFVTILSLWRYKDYLPSQSKLSSLVLSYLRPLLFFIFVS